MWIGAPSVSALESCGSLAYCKTPPGMTSVKTWSKDHGTG
jgi:hypothetical protein